MNRSCFANYFGYLLLAGGFSLLQAGSFSVTPVRIELSARLLRTTIMVRNAGEDAATMQARIVLWSAKGTEEILSDSNEILLSPPIFTVAPGHAQVMRLGLRRPRPDGTEGTYRLILEEVPPPRKPGGPAVATVVKISLPIFVKPRLPSPQLAWELKRASDQEIHLLVQNHGNAHVQIRKLSVTLDGAPKPVFVEAQNTYVLRDGRKEWVIHDEQLAGVRKMLLQAETDNGRIHEDLVPDGQ